MNDKIEWDSGKKGLVSLVMFNLFIIKKCFLENFKSTVYATCPIIMYILSHPTTTFLRFPRKQLGPIVYGLCFSWANVSSVRCIHCYVITVRSSFE